MQDEKAFYLKFQKKEQVNYDTWNFFFEKPIGFKYSAGQYVKIKLPIEHPDNRGISRYFTLSSSPTEEHLTITTRIIKSTFKKTLDSLEKGQKVEVRGVWGDFVLDESDKRTRIFIAGGIGLTPFRSMLKYILDMKLDIPIVMINSYKTEKDAQISKIITPFEKQIPHFSLNIVYVRITTDLLQKELDLNTQHMYYIAGPEKMVSSLALSLRKINTPEEFIKIDDFPGYT
ncbi:MAG: FAD-dependent oxidoreductase [Candidatus Levybacteria bacterium]|nr:FAD-dependent oxidoreductase [Candidatus Levybacteria bacterium]